jgi:hypothetical protein
VKVVYVAAVVLVITLAGQMLAVQGGVSAGGARSSTTSPQVQDFRKQPLFEREELDSNKSTPLVDERYIRTRLLALLKKITLSPDRPIGPNKVASRVLTYFVVVRFDVPDIRAIANSPSGSLVADTKRFVDVAFPPSGSVASEQLLSRESQTWFDSWSLDYLKAIDSVLSEIGDGFVPAKTSEAADVLVHISLAERLQTSASFQIEDMVLYPQRQAPNSLSKNLRPLLLTFPWTLTRLWIADEQESPKSSSISGGEIWIEYPVRTFWQEAVARYALDHPSEVKLLGLGSTKEHVISAFRRPNRTELEPLQQSVWRIRDRTTSALTDSTLLSVATDVVRPMPADDMHLPDPNYSKDVHASALAARLGRALTVFETGLQSGGMLIDNAGTNADAIRQTSDVLPTVSLNNYETSFDQRFDDRLVRIIKSHQNSKFRKWLSLLSNENPSLATDVQENTTREQFADQIMIDHKADIASALAGAAIDLRSFVLVGNHTIQLFTDRIEH